MEFGVNIRIFSNYLNFFIWNYRITEWMKLEETSGNDLVSQAGDSTTSWANCSCVWPSSQWQKIYVYMEYPAIQFMSTAIGYHQEKSGSIFTMPSPPGLIRFSRFPFSGLNNPSILNLFLYVRCSSPFIIPGVLCSSRSTMSILDTTLHLSDFICSSCCSKQSQKNA